MQRTAVVTGGAGGIGGAIVHALSARPSATSRSSRTLVPEDTAALVAFLASDAAGAITGQTLLADAGSVFH